MGKIHKDEGLRYLALPQGNQHHTGDVHILEYLLGPLHVQEIEYQSSRVFESKLTICNRGNQAVYGYRTVEYHLRRHCLLTHEVTWETLLQFEKQG